MAEDNSVALPHSVAWLGYGGLIPFLTLAPASLLDHHHGALWGDALVADPGRSSSVLSARCIGDWL